MQKARSPKLASTNPKQTSLPPKRKSRPSVKEMLGEVRVQKANDRQTFIGRLASRVSVP